MIVRLVALILFFAAGYVWFKPNVIPDPALRDKVLGLTTQVDQSQLKSMALWLWDQVQKTFLTLAKNVSLPKEVTGLPEEVVVEEAVVMLTDQLKQLPATKAKEIKQNFCADIVAESQKTGAVAGAKTE